MIALYIWFRLRRRQRWLAHVHTLGDLLALTPTQFELAVGELLTHWGYRDVRHTGGGGDLAADLTCRTADGRLLVVQCKRYAPGNSVGSPEVQTFIGIRHVERASWNTPWYLRYHVRLHPTRPRTGSPAQFAHDRWKRVDTAYPTVAGAGANADAIVDTEMQARRSGQERGDIVWPLD